MYHYVKPEEIKDESIRYGNWRDMKLAVFDLETTSADPMSPDNKIVQICIQIYKKGKLVDSLNEKVNPSIPIPLEASAIHGIFDSDVESRPTFSATQDGISLAERVAKVLSKADVLVAYNGISFDLLILQREMYNAGLRLRMPILDPYVFAQSLRGLKSRKLSSLGAYYSIAASGDLHDAEVDVKLLAEITETMGLRMAIPWSLDEALELQRIEGNKLFAKWAKRTGNPNAFENYENL